MRILPFVLTRMKSPGTPSSNSIIDTLRARKSAMTIDELADTLGVSRPYLYKHVHKGNIPSLHLPGAIRFDPRVISDWLIERSA